MHETLQEKLPDSNALDIPSPYHQESNLPKTSSADYGYNIGELSILPRENYVEADSGVDAQRSDEIVSDEVSLDVYLQFNQGENDLKNLDVATLRSGSFQGDAIDFSVSKNEPLIQRFVDEAFDFDSLLSTVGSVAKGVNRVEKVRNTLSIKGLTLTHATSKNQHYVIVKGPIEARESIGLGKNANRIKSTNNPKTAAQVKLNSSLGRDYKGIGKNSGLTLGLSLASTTFEYLYNDEDILSLNFAVDVGFDVLKAALAEEVGAFVTAKLLMALGIGVIPVVIAVSTGFVVTVGMAALLEYIHEDYRSEFKAYLNEPTHSKEVWNTQCLISDIVNDPNRRKQSFYSLNRENQQALLKTCVKMASDSSLSNEEKQICKDILGIFDKEKTFPIGFPDLLNKHTYPTIGPAY